MAGWRGTPGSAGRAGLVHRRGARRSGQSRAGFRCLPRAHRDRGNARLERVRAGRARRIRAGVPAAQPRGNALYPSAEEVLAAATGGARPGGAPARARTRRSPSRSSTQHGQRRFAGTDRCLRRRQPARQREIPRQSPWRAPGARSASAAIHSTADDAMVFLHPETHGKPAGAIVVGLGTLGELLPGSLTQALRQWPDRIRAAP